MSQKYKAFTFNRSTAGLLHFQHVNPPQLKDFVPSSIYHKHSSQVQLLLFPEAAIMEALLLSSRVRTTRIHLYCSASVTDWKT